MAEKAQRRSVRRALYYTLLLLLAAGLSLYALLLPGLTPLSATAVQVGQVAPQEITAPHEITYRSKILTEQAREAAASAVAPVYTPFDTGVARQQLERLRTALAYISGVRADKFSTPEQKISDLTALDEVHLSQEALVDLLALSDTRWQSVQQEAKTVLEQVMRLTIRDDRLEETRRSVPALVSLSLSEDQARIVAELVEAFVAPNSLYSESLTATARQKARDAVEPVTRSFKNGEIIVRRGQVIDALDIEALQALDLGPLNITWKEIASATALVALSLGFMLFYLLRRNSTLIHDPRGLGIITALYLLFLLIARLIVPAYQSIAYVFPLAAYGLTACVLFGAEPALISSITLAVLAAYGIPNSLDLTLFYMFSSLFGVLAMGRARRLTAFFRAGAVVALCGIVIVLAYRLPQNDSDWLGVLTLGTSSLLNGIASGSLTVLLQFFLAQFLGMTTALQLMEISRPDHPLLQFILRNAPGTYQHSLQVANLAEQAAERIGADPLLTRVGALYHDAGKALNPIFFVENQPPGNLNPHDDLDPITSAQTIIQHVADGLELARQYRVPRRIQDFIAEHHGSMLARYQYVRAVQAAGGDEKLIDEAQFRYPGPRPKSRETAILMLADGCEARVRADHPKDADELRQLIKTVVSDRAASGQLDKTTLTLRDLDRIVDSFTATLRGIYHPRIQYPQLEPGAAPAEIFPGSFAQKTVPIPRSTPNLPAGDGPEASPAAPNTNP